MHRTAAHLLLATVLGATLAACGDDEPPSAGPSTSRPSSSATTSPSPSASSAAPSEEPSRPSQIGAVALYYLRDTGRTGPRLYREFHSLPVSADDPVGDAVEAMLTEEPDDGDYTSLWADGTSVHSVTVDGTTATVDLSAEAKQSGGGSAFEQATLQQLVHTVTAADTSVRSVRLLVDGAPVETLWGAADASEPMSRGPAAEVLGPVWLLTPTEGGSIARGATFGGEASVFEATVSWAWVQGDTVVAEGFSTAAEGAPGRGAWEATVDVPPGDYELRAFESSAEDGSVTFLDTKRVTVTG